MREIKFRDWDFQNSCMVPLVGIYNKNSMQFTGLKDKNGIEIYDGDILILCEDLDSIFEVFYNEGCGLYRLRPHHHNSRCGGYIPPINSANLKVVGNIYENPELLGGK